MAVDTENESIGCCRAIVLAIVLLLAAVLRLVNLGQSPPGLNQDEAANAWNAYCLLKTGHDQVGAPWPVFYSRAMGNNRSTLYFYVLLPFQAIGGLSVLTARLPAAVGGTLTVLLIYLVGARLFDRWVGLAAAGLLAVNPWSLFLSRVGSEASICPLLVLGCLLLLIRADMVICDRRSPEPRILRAALAGAATGVFCYGYQAMRMFLPLFIIAIGLITWRTWSGLLKTRKGAAAIVAFILGVAITLGPLAWKHVMEPEVMNKAHVSDMIWRRSDPIRTNIQKVFAEYIGHFGPDFLFVNGDHITTNSPPDIGQFHWYILPMLVVGVISLARRLRSSRGSRILLVWLLAYPVSDTLYTHESMNALRSCPGMCGLVLLAAVGTVECFRWLRRRDWTIALPVGAMLSIAVFMTNVGYMGKFFGEYNRRREIYYSHYVHVLDACDWLRPRLSEFDSVFFCMYQPYIITTVGLQYDPHDWHSDIREVVTTEYWDMYTRYGKIYFNYQGSVPRALSKLQENGKSDHVILIAQPGQLHLEGGSVVHVIREADGKDALWIYDVVL